MFNKKPDACRRLIPLAVSLCALSYGVPAFGQTAADQGQGPAKNSDSTRGAVSQAKPTSPNATVNLVNLLVKQGVLKEEQAQALINRPTTKHMCRARQPRVPAPRLTMRRKRRARLPRRRRRREPGM
jgi:hypothetical protein